jgi:hypothetical protein
MNAVIKMLVAQKSRRTKNSSPKTDINPPTIKKSNGGLLSQR